LVGRLACLTPAVPTGEKSHKYQLREWEGGRDGRRERGRDGGREGSRDGWRERKRDNYFMSIMMMMMTRWSI